MMLIINGLATSLRFIMCFIMCFIVDNGYINADCLYSKHLLLDTLHPPWNIYITSFLIGYIQVLFHSVLLQTVLPRILTRLHSEVVGGA